MKVSCQLCSKKYDLEKNSGRCPKCGLRYYVTEEMILANPSIANFGNEEQQKTSSSARKKKRSVWYYMVTVLEIAILIFLFLVPRLVTLQEEKKLKERRVDFEMEPIELSPSDPIQVGEYDIILDQPKEFLSYDWKIEDGYEVIGVPFHIENVSGEDTFSYYSYPQRIDVYLITKDGRYIDPLYAFDLEGLLEPAQQEALEKELGVEVCDAFDQQEGILLFIVKYADEEGLFLNLFQKTDEGRILDKVIVIRELEVFR